MEGLEEEDDGQGVDLNDEDDKMRIQFSSLGRVAVGIDGQATEVPQDPNIKEQDEMITREIDPELSVQERAQQPRGLWETIRTMWYLGLVCFGGSQAHLSILENLFVKQKAWMTSSIFAAISRLSQTIPGAASTHIIFAIAALKGGWAAGFLAVVLFFFPGFVIMTILGMVVATFTDKSSLVLYVEHALGASAVGIYALTVYRICGKLLTTRTAEAIAFGSASASIFVPDVLRATLGEGPTIVWVYPLILGAGGAVTFLQWFFLRKIDVVDGRDDRPDEESGKSEAVEEVGKEAAKEEKEPSTHGLDDDDSLFEMPSISPFELALRIEREEQEEEERARAAGLSPEHSLPSDEEIEKNMLKAFVPLDGRVGYFFLALAALMLLFSSIILLVVTTYSLIKWFSLFNVIGAFVFANPQAMIPFFVSDVVEHAPYKDVDGSISTSDPWSHHRDFERDLIMGFAIIQAMPGPMFNLSPFLGALLAGFPGAILCWLGLVTPGLFLMAGLLPHWRAFRGMKGVQQALLGINAATIGLIIAAAIHLWNIAVGENDLKIILALGSFLAAYWRIPTPLIALVSSFFGVFYYFAGPTLDDLDSDGLS